MTDASTDKLAYDVIVIGGGASGMMAAITAAEKGAQVLLLEKNKRLGEKLRITGGGRCNVTNAEDDVRALLKNYGDSEKFLYSAFSQYGISDTFSFFETNKLPLKVEARNRAFPVTEKASDVVHVLTNRLHRLGVTLLTNTAVTAILSKNNTIHGIQCGNSVYTAKAYILATGGSSYPQTGSTGDGFTWLKKLGHSVHTPTPTITPLACSDEWLTVASGTKLTQASVTFYAQDKKQFSITGDVLVAHFGLTGPTILNNAHKVADLLQYGTVTASIDLFTGVQPQALDKQVIDILNTNGVKLFKNVLPQLVPSALIGALKALLPDPSMLETKCSEINKTQRQFITTLLKNIPVTVTGLMGFEKAVVADGGVPLQELDMRTMQSCKVSNLFITGDLLHINRPSGGFSLQLCWTTGHVAGVHAAALSV